ncbi:MAG TPA: D-alanyl-lipoteichoic acid biosynthesis protein DltB [Anaerolineales bacterium]|nr:D-alanyl-lipoteichoic acid biosynthesis protein DltB [Anaerolineales bacterium]
MIPYADFLYFGLSLYALVPALVVGRLRRVWRAWVVLATLLMLAVQYLGIGQDITWPVNGLVAVLAYAITQGVVAAGLMRVRRRGPNRIALLAAIFLGLAPLLAAKYAYLAGVEYPLVFVGLSYVTFRSLDVLLGIHDGVITRLDPFRYLVFLLFFPSISSGPIDRYRRFSEDWERPRDLRQVLDDADQGIHRIFTGFLYKFVLAALIQQHWMDPVAAAEGIGANISYMYAYSLYLFFDFAGYSAFAVGFSLLLGIHTPENFNRPFLARDIRDFWNRWHMSLSFWFRDHIYNRFIFAALKGRWFPNSQLASTVGYVITMALMGVWHGTALHFVVYGLYHGVLLAATSAFDRRFKGNRLLNSPDWRWRSTSVFVTFHAVTFGLLIFSGHLF